MRKTKEKLEHKDLLSDDAKNLLLFLYESNKKRVDTMLPVAYELEWRGLIRTSRRVAYITESGKFAAKCLKA